MNSRRAQGLVAFHGDSWLSPQWAIVIDNATVDVTDWVVRATARKNYASDEAMFTWDVPSGRILLGSAVVQRSDGGQITTGTVQLQLRPTDWAGKPRSWSGIIDVELSSDDSTTPAYRHTVIRGREFRVAPDVQR